MQKFKLVFIELPREKGRLVLKIYRRFRVKILMRGKKYPGFLAKKAPYLTIKEFGRSITAFQIDGTLFSPVLIIPEYIVEELSEQLDKIGIEYLPDRTADIDVFSIPFDKRMMAMKRFWGFYEPKERARVKEFVLNLTRKIRKRRRTKNNELLEDSLWALEIVRNIKQIDWTRKKSWTDRPEFTNKYVEVAILTIRKYVTEKIAE